LVHFQVASNYINCFDKLIDAFDEIGSSLPQLQEIESMFKGNRQFVDYLALLYQEIIEFHLETLVFFRQKSNLTGFLMKFSCWLDGLRLIRMAHFFRFSVATSNREVPEDITKYREP